jgi:hypothetical protein
MVSPWGVTFKLAHYEENAEVIVSWRFDDVCEVG